MTLAQITLLTLGFTVSILSGDELWQEGDFSRLFAKIQPIDEAWREIPWLASLVPAQRRSAESSKRPCSLWPGMVIRWAVLATMGVSTRGSTFASPKVHAPLNEQFVPVAIDQFNQIR